jgi:hypothetical protein
MTLSANDHFKTRELSIGELETAAGGFDLGGIIGGIIGSQLGIPHGPHPHHPLPPHLNIPIILPPLSFF